MSELIVYWHLLFIIMKNMKPLKIITILIMLFASGVVVSETKTVIHDAHIHYDQDVWEALPTAHALQMLSDENIKRALVSGGALFPSMREEYAKRGVQVLQAYATADLGVIA